MGANRGQVIIFTCTEMREIFVRIKYFYSVYTYLYI
nr:MAG TPA: hypothetical protein [Caudoviricetes sp.]